MKICIHPDECIDCGACEPECRWQAILEEPAVPDPLKTQGFDSLAECGKTGIRGDFSFEIHVLNF